MADDAQYEEMERDELLDRAHDGDPYAMAEIAGRDNRDMRGKLTRAEQERDDAVALLQRYVVRLPPQKPGSTDGDTQAFLNKIGRLAVESEDIPF